LDLEPRGLEPQPRVARAERVLEQDVTDVACVVVSGHEDDVLTGERLELQLRQRVLVGIAVVREVARHDDDVRLGLVDLADSDM
jgi:hypothetical protein